MAASNRVENPLSASLTGGLKHQGQQEYHLLLKFYESGESVADGESCEG